MGTCSEMAVNGIPVVLSLNLLLCLDSSFDDFLSHVH